MKKRERKLIGFVMLCLTQVWMVSCVGGNVSGNGVFENGHKKLKESLVGSWRILNPDVDMVGEELYTFYMEKKDVKLKVRGKERSMERFDSLNGLVFSFEYMDDEGERVYVTGQFRSAAKKSLVLMREPENTLKASLNSVFLEKRGTEVRTVVAENRKNN